MELLRDRSAEFEAAGVRVFGVSRDSPWTHISWAQALDLNFPLLSDWNADAVHAFGVAHEFRGLEDVAERSACLVDQDGTVRGA
ncbi:MAG: redoxin domain-containing protein, partial [Actinobacteria bacterium]